VVPAPDAYDQVPGRIPFALFLRGLNEIEAERSASIGTTEAVTASRPIEICDGSRRDAMLDALNALKLGDVPLAPTPEAVSSVRYETIVQRYGAAGNVLDVVI
tara:strand:+ start:281 stop:589 length:309 start_codon:yes stop_codon:yes gene_type:complete